MKLLGGVELVVNVLLGFEVDCLKGRLRSVRFGRLGSAKAIINRTMITAEDLKLSSDSCALRGCCAAANCR